MKDTTKFIFAFFQILIVVFILGFLFGSLVQYEHPIWKYKGYTGEDEKFCFNLNWFMRFKNIVYNNGYLDCYNRYLTSENINKTTIRATLYVLPTSNWSGMQTSYWKSNICPNDSEPIEVPCECCTNSSELCCLNYCYDCIEIN